MADSITRYDNKGNLVKYSPEQGRYVIVKSRAQMEREAKEAKRKKAGEQISKIKDTARGSMAARRAKARGVKPKPSDGKKFKPNDKKETSKPVLLGGKKTGSESKPVLLGGKTNKPSASGSSSPSRTTGKSNASAAGGGRKPTVSQSRTMWVKKGDVVNGKVVKKGYLAQYGKPEKKVTANVRAVEGNAAGMKAGSVVRYRAGRKKK